MTTNQTTKEQNLFTEEELEQYLENAFTTIRTMFQEHGTNIFNNADEFFDEYMEKAYDLPYSCDDEMLESLTRNVYESLKNSLECEVKLEKGHQDDEMVWFIYVKDEIDCAKTIATITCHKIGMDINFNPEIPYDTRMEIRNILDLDEKY